MVFIEGNSYETDSNGNLNLFNVERNEDDLWLNSNYGNPDNFYNSNNRFVFRRNYLYLQTCI